MDKQQKARVTAMEADRDDAKLSYRGLAQKAGVSDGNIRDAVKGRKDMGEGNWGKVASALPGGKLEALLQAAGIEIPGPPAHAVRQQGDAAGIVAIPFGNLRPNPDNYRKTFDPEDIAGLAESIAENGVLQNLVVREADGEDIHTINSGGRRYAAMMSLRAQNRIDDTFPVPCLVRSMKDTEARALALIENLQRQDVPVLEEAEGFKALTSLGWDTEKIATACHIAPRTVQDRLQLFDKLKPVARKALAEGQITLDQARAIVSTPFEKEQNELVTYAVRNGYSAASLRDKAKAGKVPVRVAGFDLKKYKGDYMGTGTERVFADTDAFMKLQRKAAQQKVDEIKASGRFASVTLLAIGEYFDYSRFHHLDEEDIAEETPEALKELHAFVSVDRWRHDIEIEYGRPDERSAARGPDDDEDGAAEDEAQLDLEREIRRKKREEELAAGSRWQRDMLAAVAARAADYFRTEILRDLAGLGATWRPVHFDMMTVNLPATAEIIQSATGSPFVFDAIEEGVALADVPRNEDIGFIVEADIPFLRAWLTNQPDADVTRLYAQLQVSRSMLFHPHTLDGETLALSQKIGVPVPPHMIPEPEEDEEVNEEAEEYDYTTVDRRIALDGEAEEELA